jgi:hypothetical protein
MEDGDKRYQDNTPPKERISRTITPLFMLSNLWTTFPIVHPIIWPKRRPTHIGAVIGALERAAAGRDVCKGVPARLVYVWHIVPTELALPLCPTMWLV